MGREPQIPIPSGLMLDEAGPDVCCSWGKVGDSALEGWGCDRGCLVSGRGSDAWIVGRLRRSHAKLPQVMVEMFVHQDRPLPGCHLAEEAMRIRGARGRAARRKPVD